MCVPILNEIHERIFELSCTQVKTFDSRMTFVWGYNEINTDRALAIFNTLRYIINLFNNALPFNEHEKMIKRQSFMWFKIYYFITLYNLPSGQMHLSGALPVTPNVRKKRPGLWPGPVVSCSSTRWLCSLPASVLRMRAHALFLFLFGA